MHAQQQTTDALDVFTDSLAIKEDPCTVAAGPIVDTDTMPRLTPAERERAVGLLTVGEHPRAVAVAFNVHLATIYRLQQRFTATGVTVDRPRTGRPRVTTQRQDGHIFRHHVRDRFQTANETGRNTLGNHQRPISGHTRLAGTPWGITRDLSAATPDWQEHPGESPETYQRPHQTGRNTLGNHQRPISGHTRLAGTPWGITRDLSAATPDWQEHPGESPETYQRPDGAATVGGAGPGEPASSSSTGPYS